MVHKPKHNVHSFRGLLADGGQDEINLERSNANVAYRLIKFEIISGAPGVTSYEHIVQVWKESQSSIPTSGATIDFSNPDLLAAANSVSADTRGYGPYTPAAIFDNELFSRNIYVTHTDNDSTTSCNYYLELEEVPVGAATLMQIKLGTARKLIGGSMGN